MSDGVVGQGREAQDPARDGGETTVVIVDDHRCFADLLSSALASVPGIRCLGVASSAADGIGMVRELTPSVVVMDIEMPGTDGLSATRRLREASPATAVAVVTAHADRKYVALAERVGASVFISKSGSLEEMVDMLKTAQAGRFLVAPSVQAGEQSHPQDGDLIERQLTVRELEVLQHIGRGLRVAEVAELMGISQNTCRAYIKNVYDKLQVSSRIEAVNRGRQLHLFPV
jgi:DNA-binding NarL/FixJ family response regulator